MIKFIEGLPDNVIAVEAIGKVDADDYRNVLMPAIVKAREASDTVRALIVIGDGRSNYANPEGRILEEIRDHGVPIDGFALRRRDRRHGSR